jgi:hypothetical protein
MSEKGKIIIDLSAEINNSTRADINTSIADIDRFCKAIDNEKRGLDSLKHTKGQVILEAEDKATAVIRSVEDKTNNLSGKVFSFKIEAIDQASSHLRSILNLAKSISNITIGVTQQTVSKSANNTSGSSSAGKSSATTSADTDKSKNTSSLFDNIKKAADDASSKIEGFFNSNEYKAFKDVSDVITKVKGKFEKTSSSSTVTDCMTVKANIVYVSGSQIGQTGGNSSIGEFSDVLKSAKNVTDIIGLASDAKKIYDVISAAKTVNAGITAGTETGAAVGTETAGITAGTETGAAVGTETAGITAGTETAAVVGTETAGITAGTETAAVVGTETAGITAGTVAADAGAVATGAGIASTLGWSAFAVGAPVVAGTAAMLGTGVYQNYAKEQGMEKALETARKQGRTAYINDFADESWGHKTWEMFTGDYSQDIATSPTQAESNAMANNEKYKYPAARISESAPTENWWDKPIFGQISTLDGYNQKYSDYLKSKQATDAADKVNENRYYSAQAIYYGATGKMLSFKDYGDKLDYWKKSELIDQSTGAQSSKATDSTLLGKMADQYNSKLKNSIEIQPRIEVNVQLDSSGNIISEKVAHGGKPGSISGNTTSTNSSFSSIGKPISSKNDAYSNSIMAKIQAHLPKYATGGFFDRPHIGLVAEDGPEAIIPLSGNKRNRGLDLWTKAGQTLGVVPYANSCIISSKPVHSYASRQVSTALSAAPQITMPKISFTFQINSTDANSIVDQIKSHADEIVNVISLKLAPQLEKAFANRTA